MSKQPKPLGSFDPESDRKLEGRRYAAHEEAIEAGALCMRCPFYGARAGPVLSSHVPAPRLVVLGEAPSINDVREARPLSGATGDELDAGLIAGGLTRADVSTLHTVACRADAQGGLRAYLRVLNARYKRQCDEAKAAKLPKPPKPLSPIDACAPRLERELALSDAPILALGKFAHEAIAARYDYRLGKPKRNEPAHPRRMGNLGEQWGHPERLPDGRLYLATFHPSLALNKRPNIRHIVREHITRAALIARSGWHWEDDAYIIEPTPDQVLKFAEFVTRKRLPVTVDIETDGIEYYSNIRCIGYGVKWRGKRRILVFPLCYLDGKPYWIGKASRSTAQAMKRALRRMLDECLCVFHNGIFDTTYLRRNGWMSKGRKFDLLQFDDTMVMHKNSVEVDVSHSLATVNGRAEASPLWKGDVDHKSGQDDGDNFNYWRYNGRDIRATIVAHDTMREWIKRDGTTKQWQIDRAMLPIARNMTELGLPINRKILEANSTKLHDELRLRLAAMREVAGFDINPNSRNQLQDLLFDQWGYEPKLNTQGFAYDIKSEDAVSVGIPALMALQDTRMLDPVHDKFLSQLIVYKSIEKLRNSFVDNLLSTDPDKARRLWPAPRSWGPEYVLLHAWFKLIIGSGRWASSPNVQNWPKLGWLNMRLMIQAPPGHVFVCFDFSQLELRLFTVETQDEMFFRAFRKDLDVHALNYAAMNTDDLKEQLEWHNRIVAWKSGNVEKEVKTAELFRLTAKVLQFSEQYGATGKTIYQSMCTARNKATGVRLFQNVREDRVLQQHNAWHRAHPNAKPWQNECNAHVAHHGWIDEPVSGRRRHFPGGPESPNQPPNHRIQGSAGAKANNAILRIAEAIPHRGWSEHSGIMLQVHDEIVCCVPEERAREAYYIMREAMHEDDYKGLPFPVDGSIVRNLTGADMRQELGIK